MRGRHADVDDGDIRLLDCDEAQEALGVGGFPDDVDTGVHQQPGQPRADQHHVVGDYDAHGISASTTFRRAVAEIDMSPPTAPIRSATSTRSGGSAASA